MNEKRFWIAAVCVLAVGSFAYLLSGKAFVSVLVFLASGLTAWILLKTVFAERGESAAEHAKRAKGGTFRSPQAVQPDDPNQPIREASLALVKANLNVRLNGVDQALREQCEQVIDALRPLVDSLHRKHPGEGTTALMQQVAVSTVPSLLDRYAGLTPSDRQVQREALASALETILTDVNQAAEHVRTGTVAEFATQSSLISELGSETGGIDVQFGAVGATGLSSQEKRGLDRQLSAIRGLQETVDEAERYRLTVKDLKVGGYLQWKGRIWRVEETNLYTEGQWCWHELKLYCLNDGSETSLEWEEDDEIEVTHNIKKIAWHDVADDERQPIDEDDLEEIVRTKDSIYLDRDEFSFVEDCDAIFRKNGAQEGEPVWTVEFESESDDGYGVTIEEWNNGKTGSDYELWLWREVDPDSIEVLITGG